MAKVNASEYLAVLSEELEDAKERLARARVEDKHIIRHQIREIKKELVFWSSKEVNEVSICQGLEKDLQKKRKKRLAVT